MQFTDKHDSHTGRPITRCGCRINGKPTQFGGFRNEVARLSEEAAGFQSNKTEVKAEVAELKKQSKAFGVALDQQTRLVQRNAKLIDDQLFMTGGLKDNLREFPKSS